MELTSSTVPASTWKTGRENFEVLPPANLKLMLTGPNATVLLNEGPAVGTKWLVTVRVEITEIDT